MTVHLPWHRARALARAMLPALSLLVLPGSSAHASGLRVESGRVERSTDALRVTATVRWRNAWRNARNHDGVWLFAKARAGERAPWRHMRIRSITAAPGVAALTCTPTEDRVGAFCAPASTFRGDVSASVTVTLDPASLPERERASPDMVAHVLGLEMVHVPGGAFWLGDTDSSSVADAAFYRSDAQGGVAGRYHVTSEDAIRIAPEAGAMYYRRASPQYSGDQQGPLPAEFPKGTRAFWIMKYELLQGQYAEFLNHIGYEGTHFRANFAGVGYAEGRGTIRLGEHGYVAGSPDRPANWVSWDDGLAFADWAGLRPMTELEFTKAARGPAEPVARDYPWGTASKSNLVRTMQRSDDLKQDGDADESRLTEQTRERFGASYWWVMDLGGSVWEKVVSVGHPRGRAFRGTHGDGRLKEYGMATNEDWPVGDHEAGGYGYRGGGYYAHESPHNDRNPYSPTEWRLFGAWGGGPRSIAYGFRAVRTADVRAAGTTDDGDEPTPVSVAAAQARQGPQARDSAGVRRAALDYLEGFYEGDSTKHVRSVRPEVYKYGFSRDSTGYRGMQMTWPAFHAFANRVKASGRAPNPSWPKRVELLDVADQTAAVKVTAWWGIDYLLMGRFDGKWMITHVLWQSPPR